MIVQVTWCNALMAHCRTCDALLICKYRLRDTVEKICIKSDVQRSCASLDFATIVFVTRGVPRVIKEFIFQRKIAEIGLNN